MGPILSRNSNNKNLQELEENQDNGLTKNQEDQLEKDLAQIKNLLGDPQFALHEQWQYEPVYKNLHPNSKKKVMDLITDNDIKLEYLQHIFRGETDEALAALRETRSKSKWDKEYEHDVLMAFWLAIHKENVEIAQMLLDFDPPLRYLTVLAINGKGEPKKNNKRQKSFIQNEIGGGHNTPKPSIKMASSKDNPRALASAPQLNKTATGIQEEGGEKNRFNFHRKLGTHLINDIDFSIDKESDYAKQLERQLNPPPKYKQSQEEKLFFKRVNQKLNVVANKQQNKQNKYKVEDIFEGGEGSYNEEYDEEGESFMDQDEDGTTSSESEEDLWNKEPSQNQSDDDDGSEEDELPEGLSGVNRDGMEDTVKESENKPPNYSIGDEYTQDKLLDCKIYGEQIELTNIRTKMQLQKIKTALQLRFPILMGNIIRILLFREEVKLACYLTAYYEIELDINMYINAINFDHFEWMNYLWVFKKNYIGNRLKNMENLVGGLDIGSNKNNPIKPKNPGGRFLFSELFQLIKEICSVKQRKVKMRKVCEWELCYAEVDKLRKDREKAEEMAKDKGEIYEKEENDGDDNILKSILAQGEDEICLDFMGHYKTFLDQELLLFALNNNNAVFVRKSLIQGAFDKQYFKKDEIVIEIINTINQGSSTLIGLNTLILTDISVWKSDNIQLLLDQFETFCTAKFAENNLVLCYNPLQAIALTADLLMQIGERKQFKNACASLKDDILSLGQIYNDQISPDNEQDFRTLLDDKDFKNRSVLKIITSLQLEQLLSSEDPKSESIMQKIYVGQQAQNCDGNIHGYSTFLNIMLQKPKPNQTDKMTFLDMITMGWQQDTSKDYIFQHRYRANSIEFFYKKDMFTAFFLCTVSFIIQYKFIETFKGARADNYNENGKFKKLTDKQWKDSFDEWANLQPYQYAISGALANSLVLRVLFNTKIDSEQRNPLELDMYIKLDLLLSAAGAISHFLIVMLGSEFIKDDKQKNMIDYMQSLVIMIALIRFFSLFLVSENISRMLLTLFVMLKDVWPFGVIMISYYVLGTQVFSTIYQDLPSDTWGGGSYDNIFDSVTATYDATLGAYGYMESKQSYPPIIFSLLQILNLFIINILMLNFMVAILSTTYENMLESGSFKYKCTLYEYCEKYEVAKEEPCMGEIILHPPPINIICTLTFPFFLLPKEQFDELMPKVCNFFSKSNFWIENMIFIIMFTIFELILSPLVFIKTFHTIILSSKGMFYKVMNVIRWVLLGCFYLLFVLCKDVVILIHILRMYNGCKAFKEHYNTNDDDEMCDEKKCELFNEVRKVVISHYLKIRYELKGGAENKNLSKKDLIPSNFPEILETIGEDEETQAFQESAHRFQIKYSILLEEWKQQKIEQKKHELKQEAPAKKQKQDQENENEEEENAKEDGQQVASPEAPKKTEVDEEEQKKQEPGENAELNEGQEESDDDEELDCDRKEYNEVEEILKKFLISSETSSSLDTIDIILMLKALPQDISEVQLPTKYMFNFATTQDSLTAFQNKTQVQAFEYYDKLNSNRVIKIRQCILNQKDNLASVEKIMLSIKKQVEDRENTIAEIHRIWERLEKAKQLRARNTGSKNMLDRNQTQNMKSKRKGQSKQKKK